MKLYLVIEGLPGSITVRKAWSNRDEAQSLADDLNVGLPWIHYRVLEVEYVGPSVSADFEG